MHNSPGRKRALGVALAALGVAALVLVIAIGLVGARTAPTAKAASQNSANAAGLAGKTDPTAAPKISADYPLANGAFMPQELLIERLGVKASVEAKGIDSHNVMESPDHPFDVAWYKFTAQPGAGGNAVFSGHRDYWGIGPAVFWRLGDLQLGDMVDVISGQATEARYEVTQISNYELTSIPMRSILASSHQDQVTLITCSGAFHQSGGYDHRLVVQAMRVA